MRSYVLFLSMMIPLGVPPAVHAQEDQEHPLLIVSGEAELSVRPDEAVVHLGAVAQAEQAAAAQDQVSRVMQKASAAIRQLGVPEQKLSTAGISLSPVYSEPPPPDPRTGQAQPFEPDIVAYRAHNTLRLEIDDLAKVGPVIDAGVKNGANQIENVSFGLRNDRDARSRALQAAAKEAQEKARALGEAMGVELGNIWRLEEQQVAVYSAAFDSRARMMAAEVAPTPVEPGQVSVSASIRVQYRLNGR